MRNKCKNYIKTITLVHLLNLKVFFLFRSKIKSSEKIHHQNLGRRLGQLMFCKLSMQRKDLTKITIRIKSTQIKNLVLKQLQ